METAATTVSTVIGGIVGDQDSGDQSAVSDSAMLVADIEALHYKVFTLSIIADEPNFMHRANSKFWCCSI